jgi:predicted CopG family antitoxin
MACKWLQLSPIAPFEIAGYKCLTRTWRINMTVKTIKIDLEAYELLASRKQPDESFSKLIKRLLRPGHTAADLLADLPKLALSDETLDRLEEIVANRS